MIIFTVDQLVRSLQMALRFRFELAPVSALNITLKYPADGCTGEAPTPKCMRRCRSKHRKYLLFLYITSLLALDLPMKKKEGLPPGASSWFH